MNHKLIQPLAINSIVTLLKSSNHSTTSIYLLYSPLYYRLVLDAFLSILINNKFYPLSFLFNDCEVLIAEIIFTIPAGSLLIYGISGLK